MRGKEREREDLRKGKERRIHVDSYHDKGQKLLLFPRLRDLMNNVCLRKAWCYKAPGLVTHAISYSEDGMQTWIMVLVSVVIMARLGWT